MTVFVPQDVIKAIHAHALSTYPEESCGVLIGEISSDFGEPNSDVRVSSFRRLENIANPERKRDRYELDAQAFARIEKEFMGKSQGIVGIYHSHPDAPAWPSPFDLQRAWPSYAYMILSVRQSSIAETRVWRLSQDSQSFIEGKLKGVQDKCLVNLSNRQGRKSKVVPKETVKEILR